MTFQSRDSLNYIRENDPQLNPVYAQFFDPNNVAFISKEISFKLMETLKRKIKIPDSDIIAAMHEFYLYAFNHPQVMVQQTINALTNRILTDEEIQDTSHWKPWVQQFDGNFGIREVSYIKLNHKRVSTLEFTTQR